MFFQEIPTGKKSKERAQYIHKYGKKDEKYSFKDFELKIEQACLAIYRKGNRIGSIDLNGDALILRSVDHNIRKNIIDLINGVETHIVME